MNCGDYHQLARNAERGEKGLSGTIARFERGEINKGELERETNKAGELKVFVEEARQKYQGQVENTNMLWNKLFTNFMPFINAIDKSERKRRAIVIAKGEEFNRMRRKALVIDELDSKVN